MDDTGFVAVTGGNIWYRRLGEGPATPVLMLHGGPGAGHDYLEPLAERLAAHRPVVVYDQLGCGRSDAPDDPSLWTVDRSVEELDQVRNALGLERTHLFGQSWGGWLAIEYMCRRPEGIVALVLASTSASIPQFMAEARGLIEARAQQEREVPMVVRIVGTNAAEAAELLEAARFVTAASLDEAAEKAVAAARGAAA